MNRKTGDLARYFDGITTEGKDRKDAIF